MKQRQGDYSNYRRSIGISFGEGDELRARPLRYSHAFWWVIVLGILAFFILLAIPPSLAVQNDVRNEVEAARDAGRSELPARTADRGSDESDLQRATRLAEGSAELIAAALIVTLILTALAHKHVASNLDAIGPRVKEQPTRMLVVPWFIPVIGIHWAARVVGWNVLRSWGSADGESLERARVLARRVSLTWRVAMFGLWVFNPLTTELLFSDTNIDGRLLRVWLSEAALIWIIFPLLLNLAVLTVISFKVRSLHMASEAEEEGR